MAHDNDSPEQPRVEPEIIPPSRSGRSSDWRNTPWGGSPFTETRGTQRVYVARVGPFGIVLFMLAVAAMLAILVVVALGLVLLWLPVVAAIVVAVILFRVWRSLSAR